MTRRASLPGADELFRTNSPALSAVRQSAPEPTVEAPSTSVAPTRSSSKKGVRSIPRRRVTNVEKSPLILAPLAFILGESDLEKAMLLLAIAIVLLVELLNSAVEAVVDRIGMEYHELSKKAKDIASGAVFISLMTFLLIWSVLLFDRFARYL